MAGALYTKDKFFIQLIVPNVAFDSQSWDKATGGDINPTMTKYNPGGMQPNVAIGGRRERNDITLERAWDDTLIAIWKSLDDAAGTTPAQVAIRPVSARNVPAGQSIIYNGYLGQVTRPDADSTSADVATMTVVVSLSEIATGGGK